MRKLFCWLGFHSWDKREGISINLKYPDAQNTPQYQCKHCHYLGKITADTRGNFYIASFKL